MLVYDRLQEGLFQEGVSYHALSLYKVVSRGPSFCNWHASVYDSRQEYWCIKPKDDWLKILNLGWSRIMINLS